AVVGNPPYQVEKDSNRKEPIYHLFYDIAFQLSDKVTLITPGRFLFNVGQTPKVWMDKMLADTHFKVVDYFKKSAEVFPTIDIKGGVVITLRDEEQDFGGIGFFSEYEELVSILLKVSSHNDYVKGEFSKIISPRGLYKFSKHLIEKFPYVMEIQGKGTGLQIASNTIGKLSEFFIIDKPKDGEDYIQIMGRINNQRVFRWIKRAYVQHNNSLDFYKVIVSHASGTGAIGEVLSSPMIGVPNLGHTDTFLSIGRFESRIEAENCLKYISSKFARALLGSRKVTQNTPSSSYSNIPLQDFTLSSDIDWSKPIADIDKQLYVKYGLTKEEIEFIERMIKPM
ncbi:MAG: Eco57I restriction-modification methylase domain-containing protein, partial [Prevotellaceae bacterium]|nr:Eco57I restriction-modification methylase domain-containing protein [Prevotellaceae bacterium]